MRAGISVAPERRSEDRRTVGQWSLAVCLFWAMPFPSPDFRMWSCSLCDNPVSSSQLIYCTLTMN
jgi:hypothetical protein